MKRILLALCGTTSQVITETLYALWEKGKMPQKIQILTTKRGKELLFTRLLDPSTGFFYKFCEEYEIDPKEIDFSLDSIIVPKVNGAEIEDILTESDSFSFLERTLEETFQLTCDPDTEVYFSLSGGRKTMGASLTLAAQVYGRPQDKLYHILVHPDFENSPNFYYIPRKPVEIELINKEREKYRKSTEYATISLIDVPFFRKRGDFRDEMLEKPFSPQELMSYLEKPEEPHLKLHIRSCEMEWQGKRTKLAEAWFALYMFFVLHRKQFADNENCNLSIVDILDSNEEIASLYDRITRYKPVRESTLSSSGIKSLDSENIRIYISKINNKIRKTFGQLSYEKLRVNSYKSVTKIRSSEEDNSTKYGIGLMPQLIEIKDEADEIWE